MLKTTIKKNQVTMIPMKEIGAWGIIFFCIFSDLAFSQKPVAFHYPLNNGNKWEYEEKSGGLILTEMRTVIGDTLLPNGKVYKIVKQTHQRDGVHFIFQRIENNIVYQYAPRFAPPNSLLPAEVLLFKLGIKLGDIWFLPKIQNSDILSDSGFYRVERIADTSFAKHKWKNFVLGIYTLPDSTLYSRSDLVFLDSLGVFYDGFEGGYYRLRGANINGQQFGTLTSAQEQISDTTTPETITFFTIYPSPIVTDGNIIFHLRTSSVISISIFDLLGRLVYKFPTQNYGIGTHVLSWYNRSRETSQYLPNGLYLCVLTSNTNLYLTRKFIVMK